MEVSLDIATKILDIQKECRNLNTGSDYDGTHISYILEGYREGMLILNNPIAEETSCKDIDYPFLMDLDKYSNASARGNSYKMGIGLAIKDFQLAKEI